MTTIETPAPRPSGTLSSGSRLFALAGRYGTLVAFLALILFNVAVTPNFLSWQTLNVNLTRWLRVGANAGYRFTGGVRRFGLEESDLNGIVAGGTLALGWF